MLRDYLHVRVLRGLLIRGFVVGFVGYLASQVTPAWLSNFLVSVIAILAAVEMGLTLRLRRELHELRLKAEPRQRLCRQSLRAGCE